MDRVVRNRLNFVRECPYIVFLHPFEPREVRHVRVLCLKTRGKNKTTYSIRELGIYPNLKLPPEPEAPRDAVPGSPK